MLFKIKDTPSVPEARDYHCQLINYIAPLAAANSARREKCNGEDDKLSHPFNTGTTEQLDDNGFSKPHNHAGMQRNVRQGD